MIRTLPVAALLLLASCSPDSGNPQIEISDAWVRPTVSSGQMSAGYAVIANKGSGADRLVGVSSDVAARITLHESSNDGGIARMRPLPDGIAVEGGDTAMLTPGGNHLMLEGLKRPLAAGESIEVKLRFERSGVKVMTAEVRNAPAGDHSGH